MKMTKLLIPAAIALLTLFVAAGCGDNTVEGCLNKANEYATGGDWKRALKYTRKATELAPENVSSLVFRAIAAEKAGERDLAVSSATKAVGCNPDSFSAQYTLGRLYSTDPTRYAEAMNALLKALRLKQNDTNTLVLLCNVAVAMRSNQTLTFLMALKRLPEFANNPEIVFNTATFMERYTNSQMNAKNFYRHYLRLISDRPEYAARRDEVEARLQRLN